MKKGVCLMLSALLLLTSCGNQSGESGEDKTLYEHGLDVVSLMHEMASSKDYIALTLNDTETAQIVASFAEGDHTEPKAVYEVRLSDNAETLILGLSSGASELPESLDGYLHSRMLGSVASMVNATAGTSMLAAASVCTVESTFVSGELTEDMAYFYTFEDATPVFVTFTVGEGGAVSATGQFIIGETDFTKSLENLGVLAVKEITAEVKK